MDYDLQKLTSRVDDIEKTIGDIARVLDTLKQGLSQLAPPTCPPYCDSSFKGNLAAFKDELAVEDRVADIRRHIGDTGKVFSVLREALEQMAPPTCPPYCFHEGGEDKQG